MQVTGTLCILAATIMGILYHILFDTMSCG